MDKAEILGLFEKVAENPDWQERQWKKEKGGKIIGFLLTDVPEELIHAAGFLPYGICGGRSRLDRANAHLQIWACSFVRSSLALALERKLDFLDGLIIPQTCDTTRMVLGIWQHASPLPFLQNFRLPRQVDRPVPRNTLSVNWRLKEQLEIYRGKDFNRRTAKQALSSTIVTGLYLQTILSTSKTPASLSAKALYTLLKGSMLMPREKSKRVADGIIKGSQKVKQLPGEYIRLIISGTLLEPFELLDYLEEGGGIVVGDDLQNGFRYIDGEVKEDVEPLEALADRQLNRIPFAGYDQCTESQEIFSFQNGGAKKPQG